MWQPALLDIARTCYLAPKEPTYFAEWASLNLPVKRYDEGISAATHCIELAPEYADGYLLRAPEGEKEIRKRPSRT